MANPLGLMGRLQTTSALHWLMGAGALGVGTMIYLSRDPQARDTKHHQAKHQMLHSDRSPVGPVTTAATDEWKRKGALVDKEVVGTPGNVRPHVLQTRDQPKPNTQVGMGAEKDVRGINWKSGGA